MNMLWISSLDIQKLKKNSESKCINTVMIQKWFKRQFRSWKLKISWMMNFLQKAISIVKLLKKGSPYFLWCKSLSSKVLRNLFSKNSQKSTLKILLREFIKESQRKSSFTKKSELTVSKLFKSWWERDIASLISSQSLSRKMTKNNKKLISVQESVFSFYSKIFL